MITWTFFKVNEPSSRELLNHREKNKYIGTSTKHKYRTLVLKTKICLPKNVRKYEDFKSSIYNE